MEESTLSPYAKFFLETQYYKFYHVTKTKKILIPKDYLFYNFSCHTLQEAKDLFVYEKLPDEEIKKRIDSIKPKRNAKRSKR